MTRPLLWCAGPGSLVVLLAGLCPAGLTAADVSPSIQNAIRCAPRASADPEPVDALRIIGAQDTSSRLLYTERDRLIVNGGTMRGVAPGQQFAIRRAAPSGGRAAGLRAVGTAGWLRIVAANDTTSVGLVEHACEEIQRGDYLEPFFDPVLPPNVDRTDTTGALDFAAPAHVLFGDHDRLTGATGDFMIIDAGLGRGAEPGARFALYREAGRAGVPLTPVGEAIVIYADANTAVMRLTSTRDIVQRGDLAVPRRKP